MGKFILGLGLLTVAANAATFDSVYKGKDARSKTDCELQVIKTYYTGNTGKWEDLKVEASTNYGHDGETPGTFILETNPKGAKQMAGTTDEGTLIAVLATEKKFESVGYYTLKWKHDGHFHTFVCKTLALQKK